jgi:WD40 repeat protein
MSQGSDAISMLLLPGGGVLTGSTDGKARLWDADTSEVRLVLEHGGPVHLLAQSHDGRYFATGSANNTARLWDARSGESIGERLVHPDHICAAAFLADAGSVGLIPRCLVTACADRKVRVWDVQTGLPTVPPYPLPTNGRAVSLSPDGRQVLTGGPSEAVRLWDVFGGRDEPLVLRHPDDCLAVAFSPKDPNGKLALTGCRDGVARLWDLATRRLAGPPLVHGAYVYAVAYSPDGRSIMTGSWDHTARIWPLAPPADASPESIERRVEALTGMQLDESGVVHWLDCHEWYARRDRLRADLY